MVSLSVDTLLSSERSLVSVLSIAAGTTSVIASPSVSSPVGESSGLSALFLEEPRLIDLRAAAIALMPCMLVLDGEDPRLLLALPPLGEGALTAFGEGSRERGTDVERECPLRASATRLAAALLPPVPQPGKDPRVLELFVERSCEGALRWEAFFSTLRARRVVAAPSVGAGDGSLLAARLGTRDVSLLAARLLPGAGDLSLTLLRAGAGDLSLTPRSFSAAGHVGFGEGSRVKVGDALRTERLVAGPGEGSRLVPSDPGSGEGFQDLEALSGKSSCFFVP